MFHPEPAPSAGPLVRALADARRALAEHHRAGFLAAGAGEVRIVAGPPDDTPFGARLRALLEAEPSLARGGIVLLGSGAVPLATAGDRREFVTVATSGERRALANDRYSADVLALGRADVLSGLPDLDGDNALPRWLEEVAGFRVEGRQARWRTGVDLDSPLDLLLVCRGARAPRPLAGAADGLPGPVGGRLDEVAAVLDDRRAEVLVAGRTSASTLRWLETGTAARIRALVEERGLRAASRLARADATTAPPQRAPSSVLGMVLDREGPEALGRILARLADSSLVDTRVLLAHRLGADERAWPSAEDRFASDLLLADRIADPWLAALTRSAVDAPIPIVLGGHTLVGPGIRLVARHPIRRPS